MLEWLEKWDNIIVSVIIVIVFIFAGWAFYYESTHLTANLTHIDAVAENEWMTVYIKLKEVR